MGKIKQVIAMTIRRTDIQRDSIHFQSGRFAIQNSEWFYITRGGKQRGPFKSKQDAEGDLKSYMVYLNNVYNTVG